jgi:hypothetical protein
MMPSGNVTPFVPGQAAAGNPVVARLALRVNDLSSSAAMLKLPWRIRQGSSGFKHAHCAQRFPARTV